jgi:hypothetical protein
MQKSFTQQEKISPVEKDREKNFFTLEEEMFDDTFPRLVKLSDGFCYKDVVRREDIKNWIKEHDKRLKENLLEEIERKLPKDLDLRLALPRPHLYNEAYFNGFNQCLGEVKEILKTSLR